MTCEDGGLEVFTMLWMVDEVGLGSIRIFLGQFPTRPGGIRSLWFESLPGLVVVCDSIEHGAQHIT